MHNASYGKKPLKRKNCNEDNPENNGSHKHTKQRTKTQIVWNARKRNTNKKCNEKSKQSTIFYARKNILKKSYMHRTYLTDSDLRLNEDKYFRFSSEQAVPVLLLNRRGCRGGKRVLS